MRTTRLLLVLAAAAPLAIACGTDSDDGGDDDVLVRDDLPEPPADGARLVSPTFTIGAGKEVFMCMRIPFEVTEDMYVNASIAYQVEGGHHSMLYYSETPQVGGDAPHECEGADMGNIRFIGVGTADGVGIELPEGIVLKIPKGAKIYTQSHYLNLGEEDLLAQDVVDLTLLPLAEVTMIAGAFTEVDLGLDLAPGEDTTRVIDCTAPMDMTVPWMIPHMHELGLEFKLEVIQGEQSTTVYESAWSEALRDHFPIVHFAPHLSLLSTDRIRTTCTWRNNTSERRLFPNEMCATFMPFYPSPDGALLACDETGEHFEP